MPEILSVCTGCKKKIRVPVGDFTIVYHRTEKDLDRIQWLHAECESTAPLNVRAYDVVVARIVAPFLEAGLMRATFRDGEFDDAVRGSGEKFSAAFVAEMTRWAANPSSQVQ